VRRATEKVLNQLGITGQDAFARLRAHAFPNIVHSAMSLETYSKVVQATEDMD
jgi:hypothetical protein